MKAPSPPERSIETPVMRWRDSAKLASGSLPISLVEMASTMPDEARLIPRALSRLARRPVTTIACGSASATAGASGAGRAAAGSAAVAWLAMATVAATSGGRAESGRAITAKVAGPVCRAARPVPANMRSNASETVRRPRTSLVRTAWVTLREAMIWTLA
jgi:hypothetical protein